jgi:hypothetical protein
LGDRSAPGSGDPDIEARRVFGGWTFFGVRDVSRKELFTMSHLQREIDKWVGKTPKNAEAYHGAVPGVRLPRPGEPDLRPGRQRVHPHHYGGDVWTVSIVHTREDIEAHLKAFERVAPMFR